MKVGHATYVTTGSPPSTATIMDAAGNQGTPVAVIMQGFSQQPIIWITGMTGSCLLATAITTGMNVQGITGAVSGGFTVGNDVTVAGASNTYFCIIFYADTDNSVDTGTYAGTSSAKTVSTTHGTTWNMVVTVPSNSTSSDTCIVKTTDSGSTNSQNFAGTLNANGITALGSGSFNVGSPNAANRSSPATTYYYLAVADTAGVFGRLTYNGNSPTGQNAGAVGFTPNFALVKGNIASSGGIKYPDEAATHSLLLSTTAETALGITGFISGGVSVLSQNNVNNSGTAFLGFVMKTTIPTTPAGGGSTLLLM